MIRDFVLEGANAPGTATTCLLTGARPGRQTFRQAYTDGGASFYFMDDGTNWETGVCTVHYGTPNSISRDTVIANSAHTTNRINFTGALDVYNEIPGERMGFTDNSGVYRTPGASLDPLAGGVPIGASMAYWSPSIPAGWLKCDGSAVSRTTYAKLFVLLGTIYGAGDGASTFNLPDTRGRFVMGVNAPDSGRMPVGWGGTIAYALGDWQLPNHTHGLNWSDPGHAHGVGDPGHAHAISDPGHQHFYADNDLNRPGTGVAGGASNAPGDSGRFTSIAGTGIGIFAAGTGIFIGGSFTGISASIQAAGGGVAGWQNIPPGVACFYIIYTGAGV